eukprot:403370472
MNNNKRPFSAARPSVSNYPRSKPFDLSKKNQQQENQNANMPPPKPRPEWNDGLTENPYKLSRAEVLQRKLNAKSKNEIAAKIELQQKYEQLKQGKIPEEYKSVTNKGEKKFQANEAFIVNKDLKKEYENRSYVSEQVRQQKLKKQQEQENLLRLREIDEEIQVNRETTEVKITYAPHTLNKTQSALINNSDLNFDKIQMQQHNRYENTSNVQQEISRDLDQLIRERNSGSNNSNFNSQNTEQQNFQQNNHNGIQRQYSQVIDSSIPKNLFTNLNLQDDIKPTNSNIGFNFNMIQNQQATQSLLNQEQESEDFDYFDYLDYKENEERLVKLRNQNMSLYSNFLMPDSQKNQSDKIEVKQTQEVENYGGSLGLMQDIYGGIQQDNFRVKFSIKTDEQDSQNQQALDSARTQQNQQTNDLDSCFQNLNLMLGGGNKKPEQHIDNLNNQFETQSGYSITPIKYNQSIMDSPRSLLPNYNELFNFNAPKIEDIIKPVQKPVFNMQHAPLPTDYEPQFAQKNLLTPQQVLTGQTMQKSTPQQISVQNYPQTNVPQMINMLPNQSQFLQMNQNQHSPYYESQTQILSQLQQATYPQIQQNQQPINQARGPQFHDIMAGGQQQVNMMQSNQNLNNFSQQNLQSMQYTQNNVQNPFSQTVQSQNQQTLNSATYHTFQPQQTNYQTQNTIPSLHQTNQNSNHQFEDDEEDQEFARMRDMLLNTQQEIDKIIQGTNNVNQIYQNSKASVEHQMAHISMPNQQQIVGKIPVKEQVLNASGIYPQSSYYGNTTMSQNQSQYITGSIMTQNQSLQHYGQSNMNTRPAPQFQSYMNPDSLSLRSNLAN